MGRISMPGLGRLANLGSQFIQFCGIYAIAKTNNLEIVFPESSVPDGWGLKVFKLVDIPLNVIKDEEMLTGWESLYINRNLVVDESVYNVDRNKNYLVNDLLFHDYWHSRVKEDIINWSWKPNKYKLAKEYFHELNLPKDKELVSVHVRRGDYLAHNHFCKLDMGYYEAAKSKFKDTDKYHFVIFSNDIDWCKDNFTWGNAVTFADPPGLDLVGRPHLDENTTRDDIVDLIVMSMCHHNIIANSTYGWVASYKNTNPNKIIVCPKNYVRYFSSEAKSLNGKYYLPDWTVIENSDL